MKVHLDEGLLRQGIGATLPFKYNLIATHSPDTTVYDPLWVQPVPKNTTNIIVVKHSMYRGNTVPGE